MMLGLVRTGWIAAVVCTALACVGCGAAERIESAFSSTPRALSSSEPLKGVWVTRWDYISQDDVREIMRNLSQMGFTDIFWQVRGQGDAYYKSDLEPWGELLFRASPDDRTPPSQSAVARGPGYDPLELAVREARGRGMRLHAWMNVMPLWRGTAEPVSATHPWRAKRSWRLRDNQGREQALNDGYVIVNPVLEEVQDHIVAVARDIVTRYNVDGVHLDYVRFVSESLERGRWYPGDPVSIELLRQAKGIAAGKEIDPEVMRAWVRERISDMVRRIREEAVGRRSGVTLTAAVWRRPDLARDQQLQDGAMWANRGVVDVLMPMIYTTDDARYRSDLRSWTSEVDRRGAIAPGIGLYMHDSGRQTAGQARMHAEQRRWVMFAYNSIFHSRAPGSKDTAEAEAERLRRRVPLRALIKE